MTQTKSKTLCRQFQELSSSAGPQDQSKLGRNRYKFRLFNLTSSPIYAFCWRKKCHEYVFRTRTLTNWIPLRTETSSSDSSSDVAVQYSLLSYSSSCWFRYADWRSDGILNIYLKIYCNHWEFAVHEGYFWSNLSNLSAIKSTADLSTEHSTLGRK